jgi:flagellar export protein FliJ
MKAFRFRLDPALRWRATQLDLEKARVAAAAKRLADIRAVLATLRTNLSSSTSQIGPVSSGSALEILSAYAERTRRQIAELEKGAARAEQDLAAQTQVMLEANRKLHLIENLKETARTDWQSEFTRELETFAGEAFLGRLQSKKRARSSGG